MGNDLESRLRFGLGVELHEDRADEGHVPGTVLGLQGTNLGNETLELRPAPIDGVNLFADEEFGLVSRSLLGFEPARCCRARLAVRCSRIAKVFAIRLRTALFGGLQSGRIREFDQLRFSSFQFHRSFVPFVNKVLQLLAFGRDP